MEIVTNAEKLAREAHAGVFRKWSNPAVPYIVHPERIVAKLQTLSIIPQQLAAAWVHDVIEDVAMPTNTVAEWSERIRKSCDDKTLGLVLELTSPTSAPEWKGRARAEKLPVEFGHWAKMSDEAKVIKLVDRWDNLLDSGNSPRKWRQKYAPESRRLLEMLRYVNEEMGRELEERITEFERGL